MTSRTTPFLFTEARLNIEATSPASALHIPTGNHTSGFASRKRSRGYEDATSHDQDDFARRHVAIESSIFFRAKSQSPRSILWRVLDEGKSLELQSVDLTQDRKSIHESLLTFSLSFTNPIRPKGVALADNSAHDALEVFVLTTSNELYTFSLRRDLLLRSAIPSPADFDPSACFKVYALSSFSFRHPYKLVALSDLVIAVSLHDGTLLRLERRAGESGAHWRESFFNEGGWGSSLKSLMPWKGQNTIRYNNIDLAPTTAAAVQASPSGEHVFTVSLDHTLKAWNTGTGRVGFQIDLLGEPRPEGRLPNSYLINPSQDSLMKIVDFEGKPDGDAFFCIVYSPKDHKFKFWAVRDPDSAEYGLRDIYPDLSLVPPIDELMDTKIWHLADFDIAAGVGGRKTTLWIRARSGAQCGIFKITFDLLDTSSSMSMTWSDSWEAVEEGSLSSDRLSKLPDYRILASSSQVELSSSISDEWLEFLTYPGRFTTPTLETSLHIYRKGQGISGSAKSTTNASFAERLRSAITAKIGLARTRDGQLDMARYAEEMSNQWKVFYGVVKHLHQLRGDSLSLALDQETGLCWSVRTDQVAPIRECADLELYVLNEDIFAGMDHNTIENLTPFANLPHERVDTAAATLLLGARSFRASLSASFNRNLARLASISALAGDSTENSRKTRKSHTTALQQLYEQCDFGAEVGDEEFNTLTDSVEEIGGLGQLENKAFQAVIKLLSENARGQERQLALTFYGAKTTIRIAQDTLLEGRETLLDLLALITFMSQDLETDELAHGFIPAELYSEIASKLKQFDLLLWMSNKTRTEGPKARKGSPGNTAQLSANDVTGPSMTILESIFIGDWSTMSFPNEPLTALITYWSRAWAFGSDLGVEYDGVTAHVMGNLIKHGNYRLAYDFIRFLPANSWTTYLKGRMYLGEGEYSVAAASFRRAAEDLSESTNKRSQLDGIDTANLLSATQRQLLNAGEPRYLLHCSSLFEHEQLPAFAADFAAAALHSLAEQSNETLDSSMMDIDSRKQGMLDSPAPMRVDLAMEEIQVLKTSELREEISSRLFNASLQTKRYQTAFEALTKFTNPTIKRASLSQLLTSILSTSPSLLTTLPFPPEIVPEVDAALVALSRKHAADTHPSYHGILYAWRIAHDNYRAAAEGLHERLQALQADDQDSDELLDAHLLLINTLACCGPDEGWILAEDAAGSRRIVTLEQARAAYQAELDRRSEMAHGRFALFAARDTDVDVF